MSDTGASQQPAAPTRDPNAPPEYPSGKEATAKDGFFFLSIINHMRNKLEVNWEEVAHEVGYSNGITAKVRFGQIKRKLGYKGDEANGKQGTKLKTLKEASEKKGGSAIGSGTNKTPSKVVKTPAKRALKKAKTAARERAESEALEQVLEEEDDDVV